MLLKKDIKDFKFYQRTDLTNKPLYDIYIEDNNLIEEDSSITPIILSILENKKQEQLLTNTFPIEKRGGSYFLDAERGSLVWLRDKITTAEQQIVIYARQSLQWTIDESYVDDIAINKTISNRTMTVDIKIIVDDVTGNLSMQL